MGKMCPNCGNILSDQAKFCPKCGTKQETQTRQEGNSACFAGQPWSRVQDSAAAVAEILWRQKKETVGLYTVT